MSFLGQVGGVAELIIYLIGLALYPVSKQSFMLKTIKLLYLARTVDDTLLRKKARAKSKNGKMQKEVRFQFDQNDKKHFNVLA